MNMNKHNKINDFSRIRYDKNEFEQLLEDIPETGGKMIEETVKMKVFGLPMWGWMLVSLGIGLAVFAGILFLIKILLMT